MIIGLQVLSALCVFSISFSAPCFGNQKQSTSLPDDSMQLLCTNPEPVVQIMNISQALHAVTSYSTVHVTVQLDKKQLCCLPT